MATILKQQRLRIRCALQNGPGAGWGWGDCGMAGVTSLVQTLINPSITVDNVGQAAGFMRGYTSASLAGVRHAAALFGIRLEPRSSLTAEQIGAELDAHRSVLVLVHYPLLPKRRLASYTGGHFITVHGYEVTPEGTWFYYDDPEWLRQSDAEDIRISAAQLRRAMWSTGSHARYPGNGLLLRSHKLPVARLAA